MCVLLKVHRCACVPVHTNLFIPFAMCVWSCISADFSPPASPLSVLFPPRECFGEVEPLPVWDWSTAWVEDLEAQLKASRDARRTTASSRHSGVEHWRGQRESSHKTPSQRWSAQVSDWRSFGPLFCFLGWVYSAVVKNTFSCKVWISFSTWTIVQEIHIGIQRNVNNQFYLINHIIYAFIWRV